MKNKKRIEKAIGYIPQGSTVADIGCDHCYVLIKGVLENKINKGIGIEVVPGPYQQGKSNIKENKLEEYLDIRLGSGLKPLHINEAEICVIGGMGGQLIKYILEEDLEKAQAFTRLILQPMGSERELRKFLINNGWKIIEEDILISDRLYLYIVAERGEQNLENDFLYEIGPVLTKKKSQGKEKYVLDKIEKLNKIKIELYKANDQETAQKELLKIENKIKLWSNELENK